VYFLYTIEQVNELMAFNVEAVIIFAAISGKELLFSVIIPEGYR